MSEEKRLDGCLPVLGICVVFWAILFAFWPKAVMWYFAVAGSLLGLYGLSFDIRRWLRGDRL